MDTTTQASSVDLQVKSHIQTNAKTSYTFDDYLEERLKTDPEFKKLWVDNEIYRETSLAIIDARLSKNMTQIDLAKASGLAQGDISKLENCKANPSLKTLKKIADGLGMKAVLTFVPIDDGKQQNTDDQE